MSYVEAPYKRNKQEEESEEEEGQQKVLSGEDNRTIGSDGRGGPDRKKGFVSGTERLGLLQILRTIQSTF